MNPVAKRYAQAAYEAAIDNGGNDALANMVSGVEAFEAVRQESEELQRLVANPAFKEERDGVIAALVETAKVSKEAGNLIRLLCANDRLEVLSDIVEELGRLRDEALAIERATVRSAFALDEAQQGTLRDALSARFGKKIELTVEVDSTLIGGLVCRVGDVTFDASLRRQLEVVKEQLG